MYQNSKYYSFKGPFAGGYVDNTSANQLADKDSPFLRNVRIDGYCKVPRPGHTLIKNVGGTGFPLGIGSYARANGQNRLVVRSNVSATSSLCTIDSSGTQVNINTVGSISSDNKMRFKCAKDVVYCMNGSDLFGKLDGTTYTTPSTGIVGFNPAFGVIFNSQHVVSGYSAVPSRVYFSPGPTVSNNFETFAGAGTDQKDFDEYVVGMGVTDLSLYVFTPKTIQVVNVGDITSSGGTQSYNFRTIESKEGSLNHDSIVSVGNQVFYVTPSLNINLITRGQSNQGFETMNLSSRSNAGISRIMSSLDRTQPDAWGMFYPQENLIKWFFRSAGSTYLDVCVVYDVIKQEWLIDNNKAFYDGEIHLGLAYTVSNFESKVCQDETGNDDEDQPIYSEIRTKMFDLGNPLMRKEFWETRTYLAMNIIGELTQEVYVDGQLVDLYKITDDDLGILSGGI